MIKCDMMYAVTEARELGGAQRVNRSQIHFSVSVWEGREEKWETSFSFCTSFWVKSVFYIC